MVFHCDRFPRIVGVPKIESSLHTLRKDEITALESKKIYIRDIDRVCSPRTVWTEISYEITSISVLMRIVINGGDSFEFHLLNHKFLVVTLKTLDQGGCGSLVIKQRNINRKEF